MFEIVKSEGNFLQKNAFGILSEFVVSYCAYPETNGISVKSGLVLFLSLLFFNYEVF